MVRIDGFQVGDTRTIYVTLLEKQQAQAVLCARQQVRIGRTLDHGKDRILAARSNLRVYALRAAGEPSSARPTSRTPAVQIAVDQVVAAFGALHPRGEQRGHRERHADLPELPIELWDTTVQTNLSARFYCMHADLPPIAAAGGGAVVNVSSVFADRACRCGPACRYSPRSEAHDGRHLNKRGCRTSSTPGCTGQ